MKCYNILQESISMPERRAWSQEQDEALKYLREKLAINKWSLIAKKLEQDYSMYGRTGKQCRERYHNHLDSSIMHSEWSKEEEYEMYRLHDEYGNKWAIISQKLPGRTDNCVKNHFYSKLRKAIRKLNKTIHDHFRREFKEIKITILYKIIQAADEKFKNNPSIDEEVSENCSRLKKILLNYSTDDDNEIETNLGNVRNLIKSIYEFSSSYRRKPKRCRKSSSQGHDLLKVSKFQKKKKSSSDNEESSEEYSVYDSSAEDGEEDFGSSSKKGGGSEDENVDNMDSYTKQSFKKNHDAHKMEEQDYGFVFVEDRKDSGGIDMFDECLGENMFVKDLSDVDEDEENGLFKGNF